MSRRGDHIRKRIDGRWEGRYRCRMEDGFYKYKSIYGKSYGDVKKKLAGIGEEDHVTGSRLSFCKLTEEWLLHIQQTRKYSTYMKYLSIYECHLKENFKNAEIADFTNSFIDERLASLDSGNRISCNMRHSIVAEINQVLQYASDHYHCNTAKLSNKSVKKKKSVEIINHTEQAKLIFYLSTNMDVSKAGIILCISTGLRLGEICSLKWGDIDLEQMLIHVKRTVQRIAVKDGKTKTILMETLPKSVFSQREIPISNAIQKLLYSIKEDGREYVLCGNKPMEPRTYQNRFKKYLKEIGIKDYNFHALRHTFATNCIDYGMDVKSLSEILGHADVQITLNRYVHPTMDTKRKHINVLSSVYGQYCGRASENVSIESVWK